MNWQSEHSFSLSANFHGGAVCVNYPWDTSSSPAPLKSLIIQLSKEYASFVPEMRNSRRFSDGITNGYQWYEVDGGMQDWSYYWYDDLQITIELSNQKWPDYDEIDGFYRRNRKSLLRYLQRIHMGAGFYSRAIRKGDVEIRSLINGRYKSIGTFPFSNSQYYKVLPEGTYQFVVTGSRNEKRTFQTEVVFKTVVDRANITTLK